MRSTGWWCKCPSARSEPMRAALAALAVLLAGTAQAKEPWVTAEGPGIAAARFEVADTSYPHRIMGRIPERRVLAARDAAGRETRLDPRRGPEPSHVFEDISPRLVEADGDGATDAVVVESSPEVGAQLAIYSLRRGALVKSAATPPHRHAVSLARPCGDWRPERRRNHGYRLCRDAASAQGAVHLVLGARRADRNRATR